MFVDLFLQVDSDAFANAKSLQVLLLDHNDISEIYQDMLSRSSTLRVINISHNRLRFLPDTLFKDTQLEILDVSHNQISKIPDGCLSRISTTLRHLDVSHNEINSITPDQVRLCCVLNPFRLLRIPIDLTGTPIGIFS